MSRILVLVTISALGLLAPAASAQELHTFTVAALGGVGGSTDAEPGDGFSNTSYQLNLGLLTEPRTNVSLRVGQIQLDGEEQFGRLFDPEMLYANIAGEYRFDHGFYQSGVYLGLGAYQLDGIRGGEDRSDTSVGIALGLTGEFQLTRRFGLLIEFAGHWTDLEEASLFGTGHVGISFHF